MGSLFSYFFRRKEKVKVENKSIMEYLKEDESFREYLRVYSGQINSDNCKLDFDDGLFF